MVKQEANPIIPAQLPQSVEQFKPTLGMEKWLDTQLKLKTDVVTEISRESQLDKSNWYTWLKAPGFQDWYFDQYRKRRNVWLPALDRIGMEQAEKGKYDFWKDMNKKAGENLDAKQEPANQLNVVVAVQDQKSKYGI